MATIWGDEVALDPILMPNVDAGWIEHVIDRGLAHASEYGLRHVKIVVDSSDKLTGRILLGRGLAVEQDALMRVVCAWLNTDTRPRKSPLHDGYRLFSRLDMAHRPHHMIQRNGPHVENRLRQTSLYQPDKDLVIIDSANSAAAYGLFWYNPATAVGLVEPVRTENEHQRRGLARHLLTVGIDLLSDAGATRVKVCFRPNNTAALNLYLSTGFDPVGQTTVYAN